MGTHYQDIWASYTKSQKTKTQQEGIEFLAFLPLQGRKSYLSALAHLQWRNLFHLTKSHWAHRERFGLASACDACPQVLLGATPARGCVPTVPVPLHAPPRLLSSISPKNLAENLIQTARLSRSQPRWDFNQFLGGWSVSCGYNAEGKRLWSRCHSHTNKHQQQAATLGRELSESCRHKKLPPHCKGLDT